MFHQKNKNKSCLSGVVTEETKWVENNRRVFEAAPSEAPKMSEETQRMSST
jgi:hypothetical protein